VCSPWYKVCEAQICPVLLSLSFETVIPFFSFSFKTQIPNFSLKVIAILPYYITNIENFDKDHGPLNCAKTKLESVNLAGQNIVRNLLFNPAENTHNELTKHQGSKLLPTNLLFSNLYVQAGSSK